MEALNELALFAGAGGGILGGKLLGWRTRCACEIDPYCRSVLLARQRDGMLDPFPIWDDVRTFDGLPWRGSIDVVSGGFPCQDISCAGKRAGLDGERSGLWREMARIICEVRPQFAFVENSPMLTSRGLGRVLSDLAEMGFDAEWGVFSAADAGAPHLRKRLWILAYSHKIRWEWGLPKIRRQNVFAGLVGKAGPWKEKAAEKSKILGIYDGVSGGLDRIECLGNAQVPAVAALAFRELYDRIKREQR